MLDGRKITTTHAGETLERSMAKCCLKGWGRSIPSAVKLGFGRTHRRSQWEWLLYNGVCGWLGYPNLRKIPQHHLRACIVLYGTVWNNCIVLYNSGVVTQLSINPQKMIILPFTQKKNLRGLKEPTLSGHTWQLTNEVKQLGLILDKGLTWKAQLKNVVNKAYRVFW